jgi:hypothetical protein
MFASPTRVSQGGRPGRLGPSAGAEVKKQRVKWRKLGYMGHSKKNPRMPDSKPLQRKRRAQKPGRRDPKNEPCRKKPLLPEILIKKNLAIDDKHIVRFKN